MALHPVGGAVTQVFHPLLHMLFHIPGATLAAAGVVAHQLRHRPAHINHLGRIMKQLQVAAIPGHQIEVGINHGNALVDIVDAALQQAAAELVNIRGLLQVLRAAGGFTQLAHQAPGTGAADNAREDFFHTVAIGMGRDFTFLTFQHRRQCALGGIFTYEARQQPT